MCYRLSVLCLLAAAFAGLPGRVLSQEKPAAAKTAGERPKTYLFDSKEALAGWTVTGDVAIDTAKGREGKGGSLKVGPGGKALLKLRDKDESGKVELWVYDDGTKPANPKANRAGPRWGLVQGDGKLLAVGILYADYLGGDEGYTATACDGAGVVRPVVLAGRQPRAGRLAQVDLRLRSRGGHPGPPQRQGSQRRRLRTRPA